MSVERQVNYRVSVLGTLHRHGPMGSGEVVRWTGFAQSKIDEALAVLVLAGAVHESDGVYSLVKELPQPVVDEWLTSCIRWGFAFPLDVGICKKGSQRVNA